ncbi:unnamed protein product [Danaus chrysippus]|uniref:(African queen) hypothetical protein n=1 Tax=Danaus chrysippus TaxID=151541 RepID=A0A8J2QE55_9NEOP|nr:unnamed protein product [Danaus chrysippus]
MNRLNNRPATVRVVTGNTHTGGETGQTTGGTRTRAVPGRMTDTTVRVQGHGDTTLMTGHTRHTAQDTRTDTRHRPPTLADRTDGHPLTRSLALRCRATLRPAAGDRPDPAPAAPPTRARPGPALRITRPGIATTYYHGRACERRAAPGVCAGVPSPPLPRVSLVMSRCPPRQLTASPSISRAAPSMPGICICRYVSRVPASTCLSISPMFIPVPLPVSVTPPCHSCVVVCSSWMCLSPPVSPVYIPCVSSRRPWWYLPLPLILFFPQ